MQAFWDISADVYFWVMAINKQGHLKLQLDRVKAL
mgnify:CR=1 FL=1